MCFRWRASLPRLHDVDRTTVPTTAIGLTQQMFAEILVAIFTGRAARLEDGPVGTKSVPSGFGRSGR
jgi:hypothetical protein